MKTTRILQHVLLSLWFAVSLWAMPLFANLTQAPAIAHILPPRGTIGANVSLYGVGFTPTGNRLNFAGVPNAIINLASSDGKTLVFTVPATPCDQRKGAPCIQQVLQPGIYDVSVTNANGTSNAVKFGVTNSVVEVHVDVAKTFGVISPLYRIGGSMWDDFSDIAKNTYFKEQKQLGILRYSLGHQAIGCQQPDCTNHQEYLDKIKNEKNALKFLKDWKQKGGEITIMIESMPEYLSSCYSKYASALCKQSMQSVIGTWEPLWGLMPPKEYMDYSAMVAAVVRYFNGELGFNARYELWGESDWTFVGTDDEYHQLYQSFVQGAKSADPNARVGAPAESAWQVPKKIWNPQNGSFTVAEDPMIFSLINYARQRGLPLDFITFHSYPGFGLEGALTNIMVQDYATAVSTIKMWLGTTFHNTSIIDDEWNTTPNGKFEFTSHEFQSSFVASTLLTMEDAALSFQNFSGIDNDIYGTCKDGQWAVYNGFITCENIIKPSFNTFKAFSEMSGNKVALTDGSDYVKATASRDGNKVSVLLSNFENPQAAATTSALYLASQGITYAPCPPTAGSLCPPKPYTGDILSMFFGTIVPALKAHGWDMGQSVGFLDSVLYLAELKDCNALVKSLVPQGKASTRGQGARSDPTDLCQGRYTVTPEFLGAFVTIIDACATNPRCAFFQNPNISEQIKSDVRVALAIYNLVIKDQKKIGAFTTAYQLYTDNVAPAQTVNLTISNLAPGTYTLTRSLIDKDHSNSCRLNKKTEPTPTPTECGQGGKIDQGVTQAKVNGANAAEPPFKQYLAGLKRCAGCVSPRYTKVQIDYLWSQVRLVLIGEQTLAQTVTNIRNYCTSQGLNPDQGITDVGDAFSKTLAKTQYETTYQQGIDAINSMDGVKLETVDTRAITVTGRLYQTTLPMQPYSVMLVQLKRK